MVFGGFVAFGPVIARAGLGTKYVLGVEEVPLRRAAEAVLDDAGLEVQQQGARDEVPVIGLLRRKSA